MVGSLPREGETMERLPMWRYAANPRHSAYPRAVIPDAGPDSWMDEGRASRTPWIRASVAWVRAA